MAKHDVLAEEALAIETGISGDEAKKLIDETDCDMNIAEQAARSKVVRKV
jgi:hypothetical protein